MGTISHDGKQRELAVGKTLFDYADELEMQVPTSCGRTGVCHECVVEVKEGMEALCARTDRESFLRENYRLACQAVVENASADVRFAPLRRQPKILVATSEKPLDPDPVVERQGDDVLYDGTIIDQFRGHIYGLAVDVGTTTVAAQLVDLEQGLGVCLSSFENPQRFGGSDV